MNVGLMNRAKMAEIGNPWTPKSNPNKTRHHHLASQERVCLKLTEQSCLLLLLLLHFSSLLQASRSLSPPNTFLIFRVRFFIVLKFWRFWYDSDFSVFVQNLAGFFNWIAKCFWPGDDLVHSFLRHFRSLSIFVLFLLFNFASLSFCPSDSGGFQDWVW